MWKNCDLPRIANFYRLINKYLFTVSVWNVTFISINKDCAHDANRASLNVIEVNNLFLDLVLPVPLKLREFKYAAKPESYCEIPIVVFLADNSR
uniref:Uncharacterized protein n=1 Tax=Strongyloides venezuelensis TaxID=75913 RepID=A0A0K0FFF6_STRVS